MLNRVLILFGNELSKDNLLKTGKHLQEKYGTEVYGLYIKDIRKYDVLPPTVEGLVIDNSASFLIKEWERAEEIYVDEVKKEFKEFFPLDHLLVEEGLVLDVVQEKLLGFDLIIIEKSKTITSNQKDILKHHSKPVLLIPKENNLNVEKVMIANDKSIRINKSVFNFLNMFGKLKDFTSISVNLEDEIDDEFKKYMEIAGKKLNIFELEGKPFDIIVEKSKTFDVLIMGDLKHSFLFERLVGDTGLKLLEKLDIPIYIG